MNLLIVEDDENMSNGLKMSLAKEYEKIYLANSCKEAEDYKKCNHFLSAEGTVDL